MAVATPVSRALTIRMGTDLQKIFTFDAYHFLAFLQEINLTREEISQLTVSMQKKAPKRELKKLWTPPEGRTHRGFYGVADTEIHIWPGDEMNPRMLDYYLRHETGHYWQHCKAVFDLLDPNTFTDPYDGRPCEVHAEAFNVCYQHWAFFHLK